MVPPPALMLLYPALLTALTQANYTLLPDEDGVPHLIKLDYSPLTLKELDTLANNLESISFTLYTRGFPTSGQVLVLNNLNSVTKSNWNGKKPTIFVTHGWNSNGKSSACTLTRDAFLRVMDCNVIVIDWSQIAKNIVYSQVAKSVPAVAEHVSRFFNFLRVSAQMRTAVAKGVGHSLGAHVISLAARTMVETTPFAEIIALDPAKPMFEKNGPDGRVDRSHASNVQVIHTNAGLLGMDRAVGVSDFFLNGGKNQPGCVNDMLGSCAHGRSYEYYSESITTPKGFPGTPQNGGVRAYMGGPNLDPSARGSYSVKTASSPPYALG